MVRFVWTRHACRFLVVATTMVAAMVKSALLMNAFPAVGTIQGVCQLNNVSLKFANLGWAVKGILIVTQTKSVNRVPVSLVRNVD